MCAHTQKKPRLRDRTDGVWFSRHLRHPSRIWSGYILSTQGPQGARVPELAQGKSYHCKPVELATNKTTKWKNEKEIKKNTTNTTKVSLAKFSENSDKF